MALDRRACYFYLSEIVANICTSEGSSCARMVILYVRALTFGCSAPCCEVTILGPLSQRTLSEATPL